MALLNLPLQIASAEVIAPNPYITAAGLAVAGFCAALLLARHFNALLKGPIKASSDLERLPFAAWVLTDDTVIDKNALFDELGLKALSENRISVNVNGETKWFDIFSHTFGEVSYKYAIPIDTLVHLEHSHKRLMDSMTVTFSKLPMGLAIFDADMTLTHFNPAMSEILALNPVWMARRPNLLALLEKLRETRNLPEHKDFLEWRRLLTEMRLTSNNAHYSELWALADGRKLKVTGEVHPGGAVSFLFEDVTVQMTAERQKLQEMALNQAIIDRLDMPVCVIDTSGRVTIRNSAFDSLVQVNASGTTQTLMVSDLVELLPGALDALQKLRRAISYHDRRESWTMDVHLGKWKCFTAHPMPDGSTMICLKVADPTGTAATSSDQLATLSAVN